MIEIDNVTIRSGPFVLSNLSALVAAGEYAVIMGDTGQGKTTILEAICGLRPIASGRIRIAGDDVSRWKPADRSIGYVPQDLALFPKMTVREHLEFALRLRRTPRAVVTARVNELAEVLSIGPLLDRRIQGLSGGESQRVALGRALSFRPRALLLDEPLSALDEPTRDRLCELLRTIHKRDGLTTLHVTHNRSEARLVADKLLVLAAGRLLERAVAELSAAGAAPDDKTGKNASATSPAF